MWKFVGLGLVLITLTFAFGCSGGGSPVPARTATAPEPTEPGSLAATAGITATPTPPPPFEVRPLRIIEDMEFPDGWNLVYESVTYGKGSGALNTHRAYRIGGNVHHEILRDDLREKQQVRSLARSETGVPIVLSLCDGADCGFVSGPKTNVTTTFLQSDDLGVTWRSVGEWPGEWWLGWRDGKVLAMNPEKWDGVTGNLIEPLDGTTRYRSKEDNWGAENFEPTFPPGADSRATTWSLFDRALGRDRNFAIISTTVGPANTPRTTRYFAEFDEFGRNPQVWGPLEYEFEGFGRQDYTPRPVATLPDGRLLVVADFMRKGNCTAQGFRMGSAYGVLDLKAGTLSYIRDFVETTAEAPCGTRPGGGIAHLAFEQGTLWRVNTPGSCLNIRRSYGVNSQVLTCAAHGVLLPGGGPVREVDGRLWGAFRLPGGGDGGWADMEFLERE